MGEPPDTLITFETQNDPTLLAILPVTKNEYVNVACRLIKMRDSNELAQGGNTFFFLFY